VADEIFDVAVDLRRSSPTFGRWHGVNLSGENKRMLWISRAWLTASWFFPRMLMCPTRQRTSTIPPQSAQLPGTIPI
jgi:hypothetical protein